MYQMPSLPYRNICVSTRTSTEPRVTKPRSILAGYPLAQRGCRGIESAMLLAARGGWASPPRPRCRSWSPHRKTTLVKLVQKRSGWGMEVSQVHKCHLGWKQGGWEAAEDTRCDHWPKTGLFFFFSPVLLNCPFSLTMNSHIFSFLSPTLRESERPAVSCSAACWLKPQEHTSREQGWAQL